VERVLDAELLWEERAVLSRIRRSRRMLFADNLRTL
jgi:hypothetical protein